MRLILLMGVCMQFFVGLLGVGRRGRSMRARGTVWAVLACCVHFVGFAGAQCGAGTFGVATSTFTGTAPTRTYTESNVPYAVFEFKASGSISLRSEVTAD